MDSGKYRVEQSSRDSSEINVTSVLEERGEKDKMGQLKEKERW